MKYECDHAPSVTTISIVGLLEKGLESFKTNVGGATDIIVSGNSKMIGIQKCYI
jgi:hypothetical protein